MRTRNTCVARGEYRAKWHMVEQSKKSYNRQEVQQEARAYMDEADDEYFDLLEEAGECLDEHIGTHGRIGKRGVLILDM